MDPGDAHALMAMMGAEWPSGEWLDDDGELTVRGAMFALEFADFPPEDGVEAVTRLRRRLPYKSGPQTSDLHHTLREVARERELSQRTETLALPSGETFAWGDEASAILARYFENVGNPVEVRVKMAAQLGDPEAKDKAGRLLAQKRIEESAERGPDVPEVVPDPERMVQPLTACGVRWGTPLVKERGSKRMVCPNCGRTAEEGCEAS